MFTNLPGGRLACAVATLFSVVALLACSDPLVPECDAGEVNVDGTHVESLYNYEFECGYNCWSFATKKDDAVCEATCPTIDLTKVNGILIGDRRMMLYVPETSASSAMFGNESSSTEVGGRIFSFGYVDESGGSAPEGWGFLTQGPLTYIGDHYADGVNARFDIQVIDVMIKEMPQPDGSIAPMMARSGPYNGKPGRLEVLEVSDTMDRIAGRFFVGVDSPTAQPGGEMVGCFDLNVGPVGGTAPNFYRLLGN